MRLRDECANEARSSTEGAIIPARRAGTWDVCDFGHGRAGRGSTRSRGLIWSGLVAGKPRHAANSSVAPRIAAQACRWAAAFLGLISSNRKAIAEPIEAFGET